MFDLTYEGLSKEDQIELEIISQSRVFKSFLRAELVETEKHILSLSVTPDEPNDFMVQHAIMQSRHHCLDDLIIFFEELNSNSFVDYDKITTANTGDKNA